MGSQGRSSMQGGVGLFGAGSLTVYSTGSPAPAKQPAFIPSKLFVFQDQQHLRDNILLVEWTKGAAACIFEPFIGQQFEEIVVMPMPSYTRVFRDEVKKVVTEILPTKLKPGGRIINLNDLSEEQNEPQRLSGQADAGEPDAS